MRKTLLNLAIFFLLYNVYSQKILFNKNSIAINELLEIYVTLDETKTSQIGVFPELEGFKKTDSLTEKYVYKVFYQPIKHGKFTIAPFKITVDGRTITSSKTTIQVLPNSHFDNFFNTEEKKVEKPLPEPTNTYKVEKLDFKPTDDVFIVLSHLKNTAYVGESFPVSISLYILEKKADKYEFVDFESNYEKMTSQFRPHNCLEENIPIEKIENEFVSINGQKYLKYKLYESVLYPINDKPLVFEKLSFPILKQQLLWKKKETIIVQNTSKTIKIKKLPKHELGEAVNTGKFSLIEAISNNNVNVGETINYSFKIYGEGNITNLAKPRIISSKYLEIYESKFITDIKRENGQVTGQISFTYHLSPSVAGKIPLRDHIKWIYFNPETEKFDTLTSRITINSKGDQADNRMIASNQSDQFYTLISNQTKRLRSIDGKDEFKKWANIGFIIMLSFTLLFIFKRRKKKIQ